MNKGALLGGTKGRYWGYKGALLGGTKGRYWGVQGALLGGVQRGVIGGYSRWGLMRVTRLSSCERRLSHGT